jgi:hypothetical protein
LFSPAASSGIAAMAKAMMMIMFLMRIVL